MSYGIAHSWGYPFPNGDSVPVIDKAESADSSTRERKREKQQLSMEAKYAHPLKNNRNASDMRDGRTTMISTAPNRRRIFASVFPPASLEDPTPERKSSEDPGQGRWDRAWSVATTFLAIPDRGFEGIEDDLSRAPGKEVTKALAYLTDLEATIGEEGKRSIFDWYGGEVRRHFLKNFKGGLLNVSTLHVRLGG
jgi:hypothetical protein